ncbi:HIRAN domain-containing protein [Vagococcus lutrae]|uniref:HIRAN domain-containing protein n=1 Tax=Vagococcus lutrae TaxID=81947 RepID=UPI00288F5ABE|nr:HIRAN domain-containing protein [Vagococcus lutrae]MDT2842654.1 HIRAN domain-containing protein [Vagococcus lutrae]
MYYIRMSHFIMNDNDYEERLKEIKVRKKRLSSLKSKIWKTSAVKEEIKLLEEDIEGAEEACHKYSEDKIRREKEALATISVFNFKVSGISFRKTEVNKAIRYIDENSYWDKYDGLTNKEIEEYGKTYKYQNFDTTNFDLIPEPSNEFDSNAIKVLVNDHHIGYVPKETAKELLPSLLNDDISIKGRVTIIGGPYKEFDYLEDKVVTTKSDFGFKVYCVLLDNKILNE